MATKLAKDITLKSSSTTMPKLIYGTAWKKEESADLVHTALRYGFRGVDTAGQPKHYNEEGVGQGVQRAIRDGIIKREGLFIQTKYSPPANQNENAPYDFDAPIVDQVHQSVQSSLKYFTIEGEEPYFDCVLLHTHLRTTDETITAWKTLETYVPRQIRNLGISNTKLPDLQALNDTVTVKPSIVQNSFHPDTNFDVELRAYCRRQNIAFQSFWTITSNPKLVVSKPVRVIAQKAGVAPVAAHYALILCLEGIAVLDGTTKESHMKDDLEGIEKVASWAEGSGADEWASALAEFKQSIGDA
ncbi:hypothetical protein FVEN_g9247 [Fusarium venenatum]|uniref:NADP-dependent oxidoreductase domain-containing protein n=1 Tax=Fusarium venenatum TaxID=56646 RepID=A0A2L2THS7_9HYPO|nr:uncharacterized protein FVRRES_00469 [Fusarium venenatum]KAG8352894.1 hypothetical protein FVEN_g9247 [Fusarium venenatum]KAH7006289.1 NADP-dependent oxidoreductase domain-containing protein [Fusarium venenatum]CEI63957.1 unnamed protein product [Fusarium venenatum]